MRNRTESMLRQACLILAVLLLLQFIHGVFQAAAFFGVHIPAVPSLNANRSPAARPAPSASVPTAPAATVTNHPPATTPTGAATNGGAIKGAATNPLPAFAAAPAPATSATRRKNPAAMPRGSGGRAAPPDVQARLDKIADSGFLAPVMRPLPMGLLGIAGDTVFLRTADGQTGLVKEGGALGSVKLLRIGINRVLVEHDGRREELVIFDGFGGVSLLPQNDQSSK